MIAWRREGEWPLRVVAILLLIAAATLRFNAVPACLPLLVVARPAAWRRTWPRLVLTTVIAAIPLALAMPVANKLLHAQRSGVELSLVIYDLGGIGRFAGVDTFPPVGIAEPGRGQRALLQAGVVGQLCVVGARALPDRLHQSPARLCRAPSQSVPGLGAGHRRAPPRLCRASPRAFQQQQPLPRPRRRPADAVAADRSQSVEFRARAEPAARHAGRDRDLEQPHAARLADLLAGAGPGHAGPRARRSRARRSRCR